jgi:hypothetical protein
MERNLSKPSPKHHYFSLKSCINVCFIFFQLQPFENHYLLSHKDVPSRSKRHAYHHTKRLETDRRVSCFITI